MKKLLLLIVVFLVVGCSRNEITITNGAAGGIYFMFRAEQHYIPSGTTTKLEKIPDGDFSYSTTYVLPAGVTGSTPGEGLSGTMSFKDHDTKYMLLYSSILDSTTYTIDANISTNSQ